MRSYIKISAALALFVLVGCRQIPDLYGGRTIAKAGDKELLLEEVEAVMPDGLSGDDSTDFVDMYVDKWIKKQLKLQQAEEIFSSAEYDIKAQVEEFRQSLLIRKLDQYYVDHGVDTTLTDNDIRNYYTDHAVDFKLDRPLVRGRVVRLDEDFRQAAKLMSLMDSPSQSAQKNFTDICVKNNFALSDFTATWVHFSEFLSYLPTLRSHNYEEELAVSGVRQMRDGDYRYYYQITEVCRAGDVAPLQRVEETIRRILFNQRQNEIIKRHEDEIYKKADESGKIKIYEKD